MTYVLYIGGPIAAIAIVGLVKALHLAWWKRSTPEGRGYAAMEELVRQCFAQFDDLPRRLNQK